MFITQRIGNRLRNSPREEKHLGPWMNAQRTSDLEVGRRGNHEKVEKKCS